MSAAWNDVYACLPIHMGTAVKKSELIVRVSSGKVGWKKYWEGVVEGGEHDRVSSLGAWISKDEDAVEFHGEDDDTVSEVKAGVKPAAFKAVLEKWQTLLQDNEEGGSDVLGVFDGDDNGAMFLGEKKDFRRYVRRAIKQKVNRVKLARLVDFCLEVCEEFDGKKVKKGEASKEAAVEYMLEKLAEMKEN